MSIIFTEEEWLEFVEELKEYTAEAMKIDTAPWMKACTEVNMDEMYTELGLEKLENNATSVKDKTLEDYKQVFNVTDTKVVETSVDRSMSGSRTEREGQEETKKPHFRKRKGKKVLFKGIPG